MLALDPTSFSNFYSPSPYHRMQADALLSGHLWLADSIDAVDLGLVWHDGRVQHVWGLGVGLWLMPFETLWRLGRGHAFPDRIALGIAFALLAFYALRTGFELIKQGQKVTGLGFIWLVLLFPPLWTLTRATTSIFEQTVLYAVILSLGILVALVRVALFGRTLDYALCFVLSSCAIWFRPTHFIYGLMAVALCSLLLMVQRKGWKLLALGNGWFLVSAGLLALTNYERFGSATEFGHHLTVTTGNMVYMTRFGNSFKSATVYEAGKELVGLLFFEPNGDNANMFGENICRGQAPAVRWRRLDTTVFDISYAVMALISVAGIGAVTGKRINILQRFKEMPETRLPIVLLAWAFASFLGLALFYLYYPAIASRYLFDFAPAILGFVTVVWFFISRRFPIVGLLLLAGWILFEIGSAKVPAHLPSSAERHEKILRKAILVGANYSAENPPSVSGISWNGNGWDAESTFAENVVVLAVSKPVFVELQVAKRRSDNGQTPRTDSYRAMIDGVMLPLRKIIPGEEKLTVIFDVPKAIQDQAKNEVLFLCFSDGYDEIDRHSERYLYSVKWR